jgi:hypothetical protein
MSKQLADILTALWCLLPSAGIQADVCNVVKAEVFTVHIAQLEGLLSPILRYLVYTRCDNRYRLKKSVD